jgi:2-polyprenyl-3-methyl-5-hydroxy-6-metoxy-1,4-benzoquinol methylase
VGVEIFQPAADEAGKYYDKVYVADIETLQLPYRKYFDYVVCGDILEHLRDPMVTLERIHEWLKDGGNLLVTVPNIRYWRILRDLVFLGKWEYVDAGILDNTHMRFFTRRSILNILQRSSFSIIHYEMMIVGVKHKLANKTTLGLLKEVFAPQIMIVAKKR